MRLAEDRYALETIGTSDESDFKIRATGKAFRALIDGIYSDKIGAIVRELSANAFDSHVAAGQKRAFFVHAPNELRPEFYVRDYGVGMDHEMVMNLYSTLFESNKDDSDDFVGAYGLGSKTPFAYGDSFFVSCFDGRTVRHYVAAIGPKGLPKIILQNEAESTEPRGVRVGFSVDAKDHEAFVEAIKRVALGHDPIFDSNLTLETLGEPLFSGARWACYQGDTLPARWNVRQGCVIYPLSATAGLKLPSDGGNRQYLIDCPIGTIRVTQSRELVEYKEEVVAYAQARIDQIVEECSDLVWEAVKDIESVVKFFAEVKARRPEFVDQSRFVHPKTGLAEPKVQIKGWPCFYKASYDPETGRWSYIEQRMFDLTTDRQYGEVLLLNETDPLMDEEGQGDDGPTRIGSSFTRSENRRITRLIRAYGYENDLDDLTIVLGVDWTPEFWKACFPNLTVKEVTYNELRMVQERAKPAPRPRNERPAIRGIQIAFSPGVHEPVTDLPKKLDGVCWIDSDVYRRRPEAAWALVKRLGIKHVYLASETAQPIVKAAGMKHISAYAVAKLPKGYTWTDYKVLLEKVFNTYHQNSKLAKRILDLDPEQYDRLCKIRGVIGKAFRTIRPFVEISLWLTTTAEREFLTMLSGYDRKDGKLVITPRVQKVIDADQALSKSGDRNPVKNYLSSLGQYCGSKEDLALAVDGLVALSRIIPVERKFEQHYL